MEKHFYIKKKEFGFLLLSYLPVTFPYAMWILFPVLPPSDKSWQILNVTVSQGLLKVLYCIHLFNSAYRLCAMISSNVQERKPEHREVKVLTQSHSVVKE